MPPPISPKASAKKSRNPISDLQHLSRLAVEATQGVTGVVERMHHTITKVPFIFGESPKGSTGGITGLVYKSIQGISGLVGSSIDLVLSQIAPLVGDTPSLPEQEALVSALNGVFGDYLEQSKNALAIQMHLCRNGQKLEPSPQKILEAIAKPSSKLLILVHGSSMNDLQWSRDGHDHGAALERDLGYCALYLNYNSGLHISQNGRLLAELLEEFLKIWPVPIEQIVFLGHSMGGLVCRSACHIAQIQGFSWLGRLRSMIFLGSPHHGAPLERGGAWVDLALGLSPYSAPIAKLGKIRSAGVTDLRFGYVRDEDWQESDRFEHYADRRKPLPLPEGVACYAIAATSATSLSEQMPGDGLVPVDSALGRHSRPEMSLLIPEERLWIGFGMKHLDLLSRPEVYEVLKKWLSRGA